MGSISMAFVFVGILILALAVIALVIWVAMLSSRLRKLTDWMMSQTEFGMSSETSIPAARPIQPAQPMRPIQPASAQPIQASPSPHTVQPAQSTQPIQSIAQHPAQDVQRPVQGMRQAAKHSKPAQQDTGHDKTHEEIAETQSDFFDGYKTGDVIQSTTSFGRATPSIPFGDSKDLIEKRKSYMKDAISADFEPDSIDFSRVAGYKHKQ